MLQFSAHIIQTYLSAHLYACGRVRPQWGFLLTQAHTHRQSPLNIVGFTIVVGIYDNPAAIVRHTEGIDIIWETVAVVISRALHAIEQAIAITIKIKVVRHAVFVCIIGTSASKRCPGLPTTTLYPV